MDIKKKLDFRKKPKIVEIIRLKFDYYLSKIKKEIIHGDKLSELYADKSPSGRKKYKEFLKEIEK